MASSELTFPHMLNNVVKEVSVIRSVHLCSKVGKSSKQYSVCIQKLYLSLPQNDPDSPDMSVSYYEVVALWGPKGKEPYRAKSYYKGESLAEAMASYIQVRTKKVNAGYIIVSGDKHEANQ